MAEGKKCIILASYATDKLSLVYSCQFVICLIAGERCNLFSCSRHLCFKTLSEEGILSSMYATKLTKYPVVSMPRAEAGARSGLPLFECSSFDLAPSMTCL